MATKTSKPDTDPQGKPDDKPGAELTGESFEQKTIESSVVVELEARITELEELNAGLVMERTELRRVHDRGKKLKLGEHQVLDEDREAGTELVLVHRKRSAKPTGRYIPNVHYRFAVSDKATELLAELAKEGAVIAGGADGTKIVSIAPHMKPLEKGERRPAYSVPAEALGDALKSATTAGVPWLTEELA